MYYMYVYLGDGNFLASKRTVAITLPSLSVITSDLLWGTMRLGLWVWPLIVGGTEIIAVDEGGVWDCTVLIYTCK